MRAKLPRWFIALWMTVAVLGALGLMTRGFRQPLKDDEALLWGTLAFFHDFGHFPSAMLDYQSAMGPLNFAIWILTSGCRDFDPRFIRLTSASLALGTLCCSWLLLCLRSSRSVSDEDGRSAHFLWWLVLLFLPLAFVLYVSIMTDVLFWALICAAYLALAWRDFDLAGSLVAGILLGVACLSRIWALPVAFGITLTVLLMRRQGSALWIAIPSVFAAAWEWSLWHGLTPPCFQQTSHQLGFAPYSLTRSLGLIGLFSFPLLSMGPEEARTRRRQLLAGLCGMSMSIACELVFQGALKKAPCGFIASGLDWLGRITHLPLSLVAWGVLCGLGCAVVVRLISESYGRRSLIGLALLAGAMALLCAVGVLPFFVERYAIPCIWLVLLCAGILSSPGVPRRGFRVAMAGLLAMCLCMDCVMVSLSLGIIHKDIVGAGSKEQWFVSWQGSAEATAREILRDGLSRGKDPGDTGRALEVIEQRQGVH